MASKNRVSKIFSTSHYLEELVFQIWAYTEEECDKTICYPVEQSILSFLTIRLNKKRKAN